MTAPAEVLESSYARCARLTRAHGTTYYWSTRLLPKDRQRHVFALYAFCRYADDIVDDLSDAPVAERRGALSSLGDRLFADLEMGWSDHPVLAALVDTTRRFDIDPGCYRRFLRSMTMDLTVSTYAGFDDLMGYMDGSAAVIGEMMLPILEPRDPSAKEPACALGVAFQLTNFLRDVGEDLERGRVYIPQEDLLECDADPRRRIVDEPWRRLMRFEIARARSLYRYADAGIAMLPPRSARSIRSARILYSRILDEIEANDYDVFTRRARVSTPRKLATVASTFVRPAPTLPDRAARARSSAGTTGRRKP